jgi:predicted AlkP superfamily phosphohydrolase/phosphomutase
MDVDMLVHRDPSANAVVLQLQGKRILLKPGEWSRWTELSFSLGGPWFLPGKAVSGICRFFLQEVSPNCRLFVSPININPAEPAVPISEPASFIQDVARQLGPFATTGFQEENKARINHVFNDDDFLRQATAVLEERFRLLEYALNDYDDGLLFFYFSSSDLQSHMFWWTPGEPHPIRGDEQARHYDRHIRNLYQRLDTVIGDLTDRYGAHATIIVMSDHGFANFGWQFNLNSWLRDEGYLKPRWCSSIMHDADWSQSSAYGLGLNGLYLNLKGRERDGMVEPADADRLLGELTMKLLAVRDHNNHNRPVIRNVYRASRIYSGTATALAPDLIIGYHRGYRASWATTLGELTEAVLSRNDSAWSADHCADALEVPGVLWCNQPIHGDEPRLIDIAPSILAQYGLRTPPAMTGRNVLAE